MTCGFGGAGAFSDGKFNITTQFGGWLSDYISNEKLLSLIEECDKVNIKFGATADITDPYTEEVRKIEQKAIGNGLLLLRAEVRHLGTDQNLMILSNIYNHLLSCGVGFLFCTKVEDILVEDGSAKGVVLEDGKKITCHDLVMAVGREGSTFLMNTLKNMGSTS